MVEIERWCPITGSVGYEISDFGRLKRGARFIAGSVGKRHPYRRTILRLNGVRKEVYFHVLVALAFIGARPDGKEVNHMDLNKVNNRWDNLEYLTSSENLKHAWANGAMPRGERHGRHTKPECSARGERVNTAKLTPEKVLEIREMRRAGAFYYEIGNTFGISTSQAFNVASGAQWKHL